MPIQVLPPAVAAQIAAGEVIDRPASVVKELVENALDAGASEVWIEILEGGTRLIRVRDNGCGLEPSQAVLAFQRHATSKVARAEDLLHISTLGFRGEALPSIAAVAEVTLLTRPLMALGGCYLHFRSSRLVAKTPRGAPAGTVVTVRDLFNEYPARRKFLRSPAAEAAHCTTVVSQYALAHPKVKFTLTVNEKRVLRAPGSGSLQEAAAAVLGNGIGESLLAIPDAEEPAPAAGAVAVTGLVSPPGVTRSTRGYLSLFVNGRWVQNRSLSFAIEEAYQGSLMVGRHPVAVLHVSVPPSEVDVNVHPRKLEVRFRQEGEVFAAVQRAIRRTLVETAPVPHPGLLPWKTEARPPARWDERDGRGATMPLLPDLPQEGPAPSEPRLPGSRRIPVLRVVGQVGNTYIIAEGPDGLYLVDQHAAHERVWFERVLGRLQQAGLEQQGLLEPRLIPIPAIDLPLLQAEQGLLGRYGFILEPFGDRQVVVRSLPAGIPEGDVHQVISEVAAGLRAEEGRQEHLAASIACHSAVRRGDALTTEEMRQLLQDLEGCTSPQTCPHGRPTMVHLSAAQLEREFGRRG